ncbi:MULTISPECIES: flagellar export protein FliJ [unclassified Paenibacillus]|uniref:flagellar export protein FliJ n=1 Tax=unclassified Paenibacillus TaxID=185978 RepID=UPI002788A1F7|nr:MULTISPECIES: flagellar export protein FliJ [unclassified Paenibacillus]MDQ0899814.1 flagellar FliJ protein [Paenibacillus sp. V4I7]MDQ0914231.1 flagellar FliJ protein [Paenibacillus sp. V4I5]
MNFRYSFQQIVDLKNNERTQAEWILSEAMGQLRNEETSLHGLFEQKDSLHNEMASVSSSSVSISKMLLMQNYMNHVDHQIARKHLDVQQAQHVVLKKQEHLSERMIDEKVWSKAREKAYNQFQSFVAKKEQEALDEMATNRFRRLTY